MGPSPFNEGSYLPDSAADAQLVEKRAPVLTGVREYTLIEARSLRTAA